ncbi:MAG: two-component system, OmpR family, sensor histidine kinase SenX3 [Actinomycetota bacterium]|jgi:two-component system sensor histidine kinase SenX3
MTRRSELEAARRDLDRAVVERDRYQTAASDAAALLDRLRAAFDALPLGVVVANREGTEELRNAEAARLADARHADAIAARGLSDILAEGATAETARVIELHGPPPRTLSLAASPLVGPDGFVGAVAVVQDVTERHRLDAVRRDFVANVGHELRTPIGGIVALADTLGAEDDADVMRRLAQRIAAEADRAGRLIDDLLDLSRIEAGELQHEEVPVRHLVTGAMDRVAVSAGDRAGDISVVGELPTGTLLVDASQVEGALVNLIDNALKYSDPGSPVRISATDDGEWVELVVRDRGIGIPPEDRDRIFERFYRVDRARSRATGGTGLGLAIVRNVARNHGGDVQVESREGEGSAFVVRLPRPQSGQTAGTTHD